MSDRVENEQVETEEIDASSNQTSEPKYITQEELLAHLSRYERNVQSIVDGGFSKVDKGVKQALQQVDQLVALAEKSGVALPQEKITAMKLEALSTQPEANNQQQQQIVPPPQSEDPVTYIARAMIREAGIDVTENDPEYRHINTTTRNPLVFLNSVEKAISTKLERLNNPSPAGAGSPSTTTTKKAPAAPETTDSIESELRELLAHPRVETMPKIRELQQKLAKLTQ